MKLTQRNSGDSQFGAIYVVTKQSRKAIMKKSKLRDDFLKDRNNASQRAY